MTDRKYIPEYVGTVTKYVFVESPDTTPQSLVIRAYEISEGVMIKETCFGLQVTGTPDEIDRLIREIRKTDPDHIFVKDRGFPPGDKRRCRANLGGARPGYYGHEFEMGLIRYVSHGLKIVGNKKDNQIPEQKKNGICETHLNIEKLISIIEKEES
ncbi:MAG: methanogenesis marker 6 protein [Euryarchaeota archaeon]|nr:methanogenesis marker 6 protein [Euryarchaeota archaeon]